MTFEKCLPVQCLTFKSCRCKKKAINMLTSLSWTKKGIVFLCMYLDFGVFPGQDTYRQRNFQIGRKMWGDPARYCNQRKFSLARSQSWWTYQLSKMGGHWNAWDQMCQERQRTQRCSFSDWWQSIEPQT